MADVLRQIQDQHLAAIPHELMNMRNIIQKCTPWPSWTRFTSIVQHQNIDEAGTISFEEDVECTVSGFSPRDDETDIWIISTPCADGHVEIRMSFNSSTFSCDFADALLDALLDAVGMMLGRPADDSPLVPPPIRECVRNSLPVDYKIADAIVRPALQDAWRKCLELAEEMDLRGDSSFFELGGDMLKLTQLREALQSLGQSVPLWKLVKHATLDGHVLLVKDGITEEGIE